MDSEESKKRNPEIQGSIVLEGEPEKLLDSLPAKFYLYNLKNLPVSRYEWVKEQGISVKEVIIHELHCLRPGFHYFDGNNYQAISIRKAGLPFYNNEKIKDTTLFEIIILKKHPVGNKSKDWLYYLLYRGGSFIPIKLDWFAKPIHDLNNLKTGVGIYLTNENASDYLRFFCDSISTKDGPFAIIESINAPRLQTVDLTKIQDSEEIKLTHKTYNEIEKIFKSIFD